jgi:hypothetical protein
MTSLLIQARLLRKVVLREAARGADLPQAGGVARASAVER